jgi:hypothetical protein
MRRSLHLVRRFFETLRSRPLGPLEQIEAARLLFDSEAALFWAQPAGDQRHGLACARLVEARRPGRPDLARAALLHDVGKRHAGLGVIGRSLASFLDLLHLPTPGRLAAYLAHPEVGADELERAGSEAIAVQFARNHHQSRPPAVDEDDWAVLLCVDWK